MIRIELTPEEAALLREFLAFYLADFRHEVAETENPDLRETLQRWQGFLEDFRRRLERPAA